MFKIDLMRSLGEGFTPLFDAFWGAADISVAAKVAS